MAHIIDGKEIARQWREQIRDDVQRQQAQHNLTPGLAVVLVGENAASQVYVRMKKKACQDAGMLSFAHELPHETREEALLELIHTLNSSPVNSNGLTGYIG